MESRNEHQKKIEIYRLYKSNVKEDPYFDNSLGAKLWFQCKTNTINLNIEKRHRKNDNITKCTLCSIEDESVMHFIIDCKELEKVRNRTHIEKHKKTNKT